MICEHVETERVGQWKNKRRCLACGEVLKLKELGLNPRALGINPRKLGTNPLGRNWWLTNKYMQRRRKRKTGG